MWRREEMRPWKGLQVWGWSWAATASHCCWRCRGGRTEWRKLLSLSLCLFLAFSQGKGVFVPSATAVQEQQTPSQPSPFQPNSNCLPQIPWEFPLCMCLIISSQDGSCCGPINTYLSFIYPSVLAGGGTQIPQPSDTAALNGTGWDVEQHRGRRSWGKPLCPDQTCIEISFNDDFLDCSCQLSSG